jgi:hypothetical protein
VVPVGATAVVVPRVELAVTDPLAVMAPVFVWVELTITVFQDPATDTVRRLPIAVLEELAAPEEK